MESGPVGHYLLPGPALPITVGTGDATVTFDGERIGLEWNWKTEESKTSGGPGTLALADVEAVEWLPRAGPENGYPRFLAGRAPTSTPPKHDPHAVDLWGFEKDPLMAPAGAAVVARLPHPYATDSAPGPDSAPRSLAARAAATTEPVTTAPEPPAPVSGEDHDVLLRRLRELGEPRQAEVLTAEEFATAKQAVPKRLS